MKRRKPLSIDSLLSLPISPIDKTIGDRPSPQPARMRVSGPLPAVAVMPDDCALERIRDILSEPEWDSETAERIARVLVANGRVPDSLDADAHSAPE